METVTPPLTPDDIDLGFVARVVPGLDMVAVADEHIVIGGDAQLVVLNPTASLIVTFLDGEASLGELVDDFSDVLGIDREVVEADVLSFVRELGAGGLLEGVALPAPELPEASVFTPIETPSVGDLLDDFSLPDLDGEEHSLSEYRGQRVLLVNWSPTCGYCVTIADELAALDPELANHDVQLLLVTSGDVESDRLLHERHGLQAPTLVRGTSGVDPFRGTGTPAAYLLDAEGRVAEDMAVGAHQVPALARDLAGVDPATPFGSVPDEAATAADDETRGRYLPAAGAMCGPGGGAGTSSTEWQGTRAYAFGDYHVGLRFDDPATATVLDRLFVGARVNDRRAPDNYSVALGAPTTTKRAGAAQSLKLLVRGGTQLVRSRSGGRVLAALLQHLSAELAPPDPLLTRVDATAVLRGDDALLLPPGLVNFVKELQPRFARANLRLVDSPQVLLDLDRGELVVPDPALPHDPSVIDELDAIAKLGTEPPRARPGRYGIRTWFMVREPDQVGPISHAVAVTATVPRLFAPDDLRTEVQRLAALFDIVEPRAVWYQSVDELVEQIVATS